VLKFRFHYNQYLWARQCNNVAQQGNRIAFYAQGIVPNLPSQVSIPYKGNLH
jgi:hypothetical protein